MTSRTTAKATITVRRYEPVPSDQPADGPALVRVHVEEDFSGDITGSGVVEFLQVLRNDQSASFVGMERVDGVLAGRRGTFVLQDEGTVTGSSVDGRWFVVPGSGTGELAGLRGEGGFAAELGQDATVTLEYWFD